MDPKFESALAHLSVQSVALWTLSRCLMILPSTVNKTEKWLMLLTILMQNLVVIV